MNKGQPRGQRASQDLTRYHFEICVVKFFSGHALLLPFRDSQDYHSIEWCPFVAPVRLAGVN